ncbi:hypothetical protein NDI44_28290 [Trichocoleus sp. DQ-A3]|uniref:hypothetical protein n=1 Tax=Cyanophyceae TaxID=3028117 RepID=UPI001686B773|nr:hypothetical protein [Coleofasciculus sp. FACHB-125]MBD1903648.1 hypothetical protein [Coleofasciculus sp. FACHB-125]
MGSFPNNLLAAQMKAKRKRDDQSFAPKIVKTQLTATRYGTLFFYFCAFDVEKYLGAVRKRSYS